MTTKTMQELSLLEKKGNDVEANSEGKDFSQSSCVIFLLLDATDLRPNYLRE